MTWLARWRARRRQHNAALDGEQLLTHLERAA